MALVEKVEKPVGKRYIELNNMLNIPDKDGKIQLDKDKEAVRRYFLDEINQNTVFFHTLREKIDYLVTNGYIESWFIELYDFEFIKELFQEVYDYKHRFQSFMGAYKFYNQYAMKTEDGTRYLERYEDRIAFTALYLAKGDMDFAMDLAIEMITGRYQPATPTFMNAGKVRAGRFISCFLLDFDDSMLSIGRGVNSVLQLSRNGGGIGVNLSNLRESGAPIKGIENASSGVVPVMKILEDSLSYSNQLG